MDSTDEDRLDFGAFVRLVDTKAGVVSDDTSTKLLHIINRTTKSVPKRRPTISTVSYKINDYYD